MSLILSAALAYIGRAFGQLVPMPPFILQAINFVVSFVVISVLFALMFKYVPAAKISWRDVLVGAVGTALLFTIGKLLLGLYLGKASVGSTYGAAGSFVAVVVWIYYSAQIFFFGAEFTHIRAEAHGTKKESAPEERPAQAPSEPELKPQQSVQSEEAPMIMAAKAEPLRQPPAISMTRSASATQSAPALSPRKTKPRLLMAAAFGFVLGRVFGGISKSAPPSARSPKH